MLSKAWQNRNAFGVEISLTSSHVTPEVFSTDFECALSHRERCISKCRWVTIPIQFWCYLIWFSLLGSVLMKSLDTLILIFARMGTFIIHIQMFMCLGSFLGSASEQVYWNGRCSSFGGKNRDIVWRHWQGARRVHVANLLWTIFQIFQISKMDCFNLWKCQVKGQV